jgi:undecaprenyl-diphosphatase
MPLFQVVVLSIIQGITEFLPVSSTAHLALAPWLLGWADQGLTFDIALHVGTLIAALVYFFRAWLQIIAQGFGMNFGDDQALKGNPKLLWLLAAGSIPVGIAGVLFGKQAESTWRNPFLMGAMMILVGVLMWFADRGTAHGRNLGHVTLSDSLAVGLAQAAAVVPGVSRSGVTITAGLFRNLDRVAAARFSFLLATPAIAGAAAKSFYDLLKHGGIPADMRTPFLLGIVLSAVTGMAVIGLFLRFLQHRTLKFFVYYRIIFGIIVIALAASRPPAG